MYREKNRMNKERYAFLEIKKIANEIKTQDPKEIHSALKQIHAL
jgi:hypothetical protein